MEFFEQNRQYQRKRERVVIILYSIYTLNLCIAAVHHGWPAWIPGIMLAGLASGWGIFLGKYRNFRIRAFIGTILIQLTVILYAAHMKELIMVVPTFMAMAVIVSFFGISELLGIALFSLLFIIFYHGVIAGTFGMLQARTRGRWLSRSVS